MLAEMLLGTVMLIATIVVEAATIAVAVHFMTRWAASLAALPMFPRTVIALSVLSTWLMVGISVALWLWAAVLIGLGEFDSVVDAIYFTSVSATTVGYGDVVLSDRWRLLSGFVAANGLVLFSLNTAFLFEAVRRLNEPAKLS